jgi:hypothetical protein
MYTFTKSTKFGDIKNDPPFQLHIGANKTKAKKALAYSNIFPLR